MRKFAIKSFSGDKPAAEKSSSLLLNLTVLLGIQKLLYSKLCKSDFT